MHIAKHRNRSFTQTAALIRLTRACCRDHLHRFRILLRCVEVFERTFRRAFSEQRGISPARYQRIAMARQACDLLRERSDWSVLRIAKHLGYGHPPTFIRAFKAELGQRQNNGGGVEAIALLAPHHHLTVVIRIICSEVETPRTRLATEIIDKAVSSKRRSPVPTIRA